MYIGEAVDRFFENYIAGPGAYQVINALETDFLKQDVEIEEQLGEGGSFGVAFGLSDGTVLKITTDPDEAFAAKFLISKNFKHRNVAKFFDAVGVLPETKKEGFERSMDYVKIPFIGLVNLERIAGTAGDEAAEEASDLNTLRARVWRANRFYTDELAAMSLTDRRERTKKTMRDLLDAISLRIDEIAERTEESGQENVPDLLLDVRAGGEALYDIGLYAADFHDQNIGLGINIPDWKIFDIGVSSIPAGSRRALPKSAYLSNKSEWKSLGIVPKAEMNALELVRF